MDGDQNITVWPEIFLDHCVVHNLLQTFNLQEDDLTGEFVFQSNQSRCWKESKDISTTTHVCGEGPCSSKLEIC